MGFWSPIPGWGKAGSREGSPSKDLGFARKTNPVTWWETKVLEGGVRLADGAHQWQPSTSWPLQQAQLLGLRLLGACLLGEGGGYSPPQIAVVSRGEV